MAAIAIFLGAVAAGSSWVYKEGTVEAAKIIGDRMISAAGVVGDYAKSRYKEYKLAKSAMGGKYPNTFALHYAMISLLVTARLNKVRDAVEKHYDRATNTRSTAVPGFVKETALVEYYYNDHVYAAKVSTPKTFDEVLMVTDENGNNVHKNIRKFLGPAHDFHGGIFTAEELGYQSLEFSNGLDSLVFKGDEPIILNFPELQ